MDRLNSVAAHGQLLKVNGGAGEYVFGQLLDVGQAQPQDPIEAARFDRKAGAHVVFEEHDVGGLGLGAFDFLGGLGVEHRG